MHKIFMQSDGDNKNTAVWGFLFVYNDIDCHAALTGIRMLAESIILVPVYPGQG